MCVSVCLGVSVFRCVFRCVSVSVFRCVSVFKCV